jgi:hypothetical protein
MGIPRSITRNGQISVSFSFRNPCNGTAPPDLRDSQINRLVELHLLLEIKGAIGASSLSLWCFHRRDIDDKQTLHEVREGSKGDFPASSGHVRLTESGHSVYEYAPSCEDTDQDSRLIVLWLTLYERAMSVSTSPASRRAIASRR